MALLLALASAGPAFGQQMLYDWLPANDESVQLDPTEFHTGRVYRPGPEGGNIHVDIEARQPVTIEMADNEDWNFALQHPEALASLRFFCVREHVVKTTYVCDLHPGGAMVLIVRDDRNADRSVLADLGTILSSKGGARQLVSPNDLHIQYYRWACVQNCNPPQIQWTQQVKEKYDLTPILKIYGGLLADRDGEQVSIKIKAPIAMAVAILPSQTADQLYGKPPEAFDAALATSTCKQRGIQSLSFECTLNLADGPQSLVVVPEPGVAVPNHKKAELQVLAARCVANCVVTTPKPEEKRPEN